MSNKSRTAVEAAFRKLSAKQRADILASWGFAAFADVPDSTLEGVSADILAANPLAFPSMTARHSRTRKDTTAESLAKIADGVYGDDTGDDKGGDGDGDKEAADTELNTHNTVAAKSDSIFGDTSIDEKAIYDRYNALSPKVKAARVKLPTAE